MLDSDVVKPQNIVYVVAGVIALIVGGWLIAARLGVVSDPSTTVKKATSKHPKNGTDTPTNDGNAKHKNAYLSEDIPSIKEEDLGPRKWKIIDVHEHLKDEAEAVRLLAAMDKYGVQRTCLMGSTTYTLTLNPIYGFEGFKENNEALIAIKKKWPDRFAAFVTLNPLDEGNLALLQDYVKRGADGLKLYVGHGAKIGKGEVFHSMPIDDPRLEPIFAWAEEVQLPIVLHVNLEKFWDEMLHVLEKHPYLRVDMPHMGLYKSSEGKLNRLAFLLERYPNTFSDMSFGYYTYQQDGFEVLGMYRSRSREFLTKHRDRMLYASDMVLEPAKTVPYIEDTLRSYMQFLENDKWRFFVVPSKTMHGLGLDDDTLHHIYEKAPSDFLLLDANGKLPDRTHGWPVAGLSVPPRPAIPPLTPEMIPSLSGKPAGPPALTPGEAPPVRQGSSEPEDDDDDP